MNFLVAPTSCIVFMICLLEYIESLIELLIKRQHIIKKTIPRATTHIPTFLKLEFNKSINGRTFDNINGLYDFFQFNRKEDWVEILRDQTIMIKIEYWFEK